MHALSATVAPPSSHGGGGGGAGGSPSALEVPVLPIGLLDPIQAPACFATAPRITVSESSDHEGDAADELAEWLWLNGIERPFLVASGHGQRLLQGIRGAVGTAISVPRQATQRWARSCGRAARCSDAVVAVGGGRCLDVAKLAAARAGVPFLAVPTQLSHDGVCSPVAVVPRTEGGVAESLVAVAPRAAFFSRPTLVESPIASLRAGIGDLVSNLLALRDWKLAADAGLEPVHLLAWHLSAESFGLVEPLLEEPFGPEHVSPSLIGLLSHALANSGIAMMTAGSSRPASGAEHKISHAIDELFGGRAHHGAQVAFASLASAALHGLDVEALRRLLVNLGLPHHPHQLGLSLDDMARVLLRAPSTRPGRFTVLESAVLDAPGATALVHSLWGAP